MAIMCLALLVAPLVLAALASGAIPYNPQSRLVAPNAVFRRTGNVVQEVAGGSAPSSSVADTTFTLQGPNASITYDFGRVVAGLPTIAFGKTSCGAGPLDCDARALGLPGFVCFGTCQGLGLTYSEGAQFVASARSDQSFVQGVEDKVLYLPVPDKPKNYTVPAKWGRGGFRFLTLSLGPATPPDVRVELRLPFVHFTADPEATADRLGSLTGDFDSSDPLLNQIWAAGAYTVQLCTVPANSSVNRIAIATTLGGWSNDVAAPLLAPTQGYLVDGARRDRNAWAADLHVAIPTALVSLNRDGSLLTSRRAIEVIFQGQDANSGFFPYAGRPILDLFLVSGLFSSFLGTPNPYGSDTYHLWAILSYADYVLATRDVTFAAQKWGAVTRGLDAVKPYIDDATGLYKGTKNQDWGRVGQGGMSTSLNAIYYRTLTRIGQVAQLLPPGDQDARARREVWLRGAARVKDSVNRLLFDEQAGLFRDNTTVAGAAVLPQDGNVAAINFGVVASQARAGRIADALRRRWTKYGAPAPELPGSISPFISSQEVNAQFRARPGQAGPALDLVRTQWGYMRKAFSNETLLEGYAANGTLAYGFYGPNPSFISLAHAWSTGPTYALTNFVAGVRATRLSVDPTEGEWKYQPTVDGSGLSTASASFTVDGKKFSGRWTVSSGQKKFEASIDMPPGSKGTVCVPLLGRSPASVRPTVNSQTPANVQAQEGYLCWANQIGGALRISA